MTIHHISQLTRKPQLLFILTLVLLCVWFVRAHAEFISIIQNPCGSNFAGSWQLSTDANSTLNINGNATQGSYTPPGQFRRVLNGQVTGANYMQGQWYEETFDVGGRSGTFIATLTPTEQRLNLTLYINQAPFETTTWYCGGGPPVIPTTPTATPTPTPEPGANLIRDDQDQDNFQTFDSIPRDQQILVLSKRGPRMKVDYSADDFSMRILVRSGSPIVLEYGLESDEPAELNIEIADLEPIYYRLRPVDRGHAEISIPRLRLGLEVAKLNIRAVYSNGDPANFELYGLAVGERGMQALKRINATETLVAMNNPPPVNVDYEPLPLFALIPQTGISLQITVDLPATLKAKQKPENKIVFSCTSGGDFSDGRWEWWHVTGLNWRKVWQYGTGKLSRNQTKSKDWNGIITRQRLVSVGSHALQMTAWQRAGKDCDSVVARAPSRLAVIE